MPYQLRSSGGRIELLPKGAPLVIGRAASGVADILIDSPGVSARHAKLTWLQGEQWLLEDLSSKNGTYINTLPIERQVLRPGDEVQFNGSEVFVFEKDETLPHQAQATFPETHTATLERLTDTVFSLTSAVRKIQENQKVADGERKETKAELHQLAGAFTDYCNKDEARSVDTNHKISAIDLMLRRVMWAAIVSVMISVGSIAVSSQRNNNAVSNLIRMAGGPEVVGVLVFAALAGTGLLPNKK